MAKKSLLRKHLKQAVLNLEKNENRSYLLRIAFYFLRVLTCRSRFTVREATAILLGPILHRRVVLHMLFEVCTPCQNRCEFCAHSDLIQREPGYQMSLEQLRHFIRVTQQSRYFIQNLWINGPGEPTLWKHLNEGIKLLHESGVIGSIDITTNGQSLDRIHEDTWKRVNHVSVSVYPSSDYSSLRDNFAQYRHTGSLIEERIKDSFRIFPKQRTSDSLPAHCTCPGPMIYGDWIYFQCGPTAFGAARLKGETFFENSNYGIPLAYGYLDNAKAENTYGLEHPQRKEHLDLCTYCWANYTIPLPDVPHAQYGINQNT